VADSRTDLLPRISKQLLRARSQGARRETVSGSGRELHNAIAAEPKDFSLHFNLALAYSLQGKDAEAIPEYKKALEMKPDLYQAQLNIGISLLREKRGGEADRPSDWIDRRG